MYDYILDLQLQMDEDSVELVHTFSAIKVDSVCYEQTMEIKRAAEEEFKKYLIPSMKTDGHLHYSFVFCEADIRYPHRRLHLASFFSKFLDVAITDFFYMCLVNYCYVFSHWPAETTHIIDRWSKEHVDCFKDYFIDRGEHENTTWQTRFKAGIMSDRPDVAEKYLHAVYLISKTLNDNRMQNTAPAISEELMQRKQAAYEAYMNGENLKEAGKRIGMEFYQNVELSAKTIASDAEEYAKLENKTFKKRHKGRPPTRLPKS